ncbi:unnamed protein product, partial [Rotaria sp. Silwood1]
TTQLEEHLIDLARDPKWLEHSEKDLTQFELEIHQFYIEYRIRLN